jgi:soluble lytic murein transglycosylase-like protein
MRVQVPDKADFGHIAAGDCNNQGLKRSTRNPARRGPFPMKRLLSLAWLAAMACLYFRNPPSGAPSMSMVATHAKANGVPEALVHRVIVRESKYQPHLVGRGGTIGLMQIKLATARGLGYTGDAEGLRDPDTNLTYAVKYLAGAWRAANGDANRAVGYYASGYYYAAKRQRLAAGVRRHRIGNARAAARAAGTGRRGPRRRPCAAGSAPRAIRWQRAR